MQKIGLEGKSFVPLLMGFGCSVPAIMALRTLKSKRERIVTGMMVPFMSCGARLPIYILFISSYIPKDYQGITMYLMYILGIIVSFFTGVFFNKILKKKKQNSYLLLEMPEFIMPKFKNIFNDVFSAVKQFLRKAGVVLFPLAIILWMLFSFPLNDNMDDNKETADIKQSYASDIGKAIVPVFKPLGFDWKISLAMLSGLGAKEIFIETMAMSYSIDNSADEDSFNNSFKKNIDISLPVAIAILVFVALYTPCLAVIATIKQELGTKWAIINIFYTTSVAWIIAFIFYRGFLG